MQYCCKSSANLSKICGMVIRNRKINRMMRDFVFLCRKIGNIKRYFCRYIIKNPIAVRLKKRLYSERNSIGKVCSEN